MERKRLDKEPEAETPRSHLRRASSMPASTSPRAQGRHAREGISDPSAGPDGEHSSSTGAGLAMHLPARMRDVLKRYGVALILAGLALFVRGVLPLREGTAIYQLPIAAVVLCAWYGGRGPGLFASLICITGSAYWFVPPVNSFAIWPDHRLAFFIFIALCLFLTEFSAGRRRVAQEFRASEARFRTFVDHATDAFFLLDEQLNVVDVNRQACETLGWSREELIGMHPREFDVGLDEASIARLAQRAGAGETITFESRHRRKDGTTFPVEIRSHKFEQGGRQFYLATARDITERKRAEEVLRTTELRFRTVVDFAADAFMVHAEDGKVIDVNRQACESLGYTREELIGMMPADFDAGLAQAARISEHAHLDALRRVVERVGAGETVTVDTHHRRKDGTVFPVEVRVRQVREGDRWIGISLSRDITERKRAEEELRASRTELAHVSRLTTLGELTTSIAHEVSQPLGAMVASAGACARWLAAEPPAMAEARSALDNIVADGKRAREVIARIRALTKRQLPRMDLLDLNRKIREVLAFTEHDLRSQDIVLRTQLDRTLPGVMGDPVQLQQVLLNLILNAIEAMSGVYDRPRELTIVSRADGSNAVVVEVRDSGVGLDPDRAERVFEAFYTTKTEGIGIGLSISRSIVEAHGGRLWATPNEPHGAVFRFSLPVAEDRQS